MVALKVCYTNNNCTRHKHIEANLKFHWQAITCTNVGRDAWCHIVSLGYNRLTWSPKFNKENALQDISSLPRIAAYDLCVNYQVGYYCQIVGNNAQSRVVQTGDWLKYGIDLDIWPFVSEIRIRSSLRKAIMQASGIVPVRVFNERVV